MSEGRMEKLNATGVQQRLAALSGWSLSEDGQISKTYKLTGFPQSMLFVNSIGLLAEKAQHHPDIVINWNRVTLALSTHDAGGLTALDFDLAQQIDNLPII